MVAKKKKIPSHSRRNRYADSAHDENDKDDDGTFLYGGDFENPNQLILVITSIDHKGSQGENRIRAG